ncbi:acetyltransferase [Cladophialophora psammophila CBS 110553]|uniref:Acetyltransferase n=1 Tax=Cladophialophora psammophila CBS 110553 TaxID=1182543 RepID=W9WLU4_9EURO|nr:acetyltransferase [Cladophialophora psammophila CBS 110553]EXJ59404.1 acetyltransferase [Cladophialophora psammophila CBS 110553]
MRQRIGSQVSSAPGSRPSRVTLTATTVVVEPLTPSHATDLYDSVKGDSNNHLWTYLFDNPFASLAAFQEAVTAKSHSEDPIFFAIVDKKSAKPVGWISLMRIDTRHRVVEVGNILFSPLLQRTKVATEAMYLLAKYVFETLQYRRYEWKCDNLNAPSQRAAIRFGFMFEGVFRKHMIYKGRSRNTCWFSMVDDDWFEGGVKRGFEDWLDEGNFDEDGKQRRRLEDVRRELKGQKGPVVLEL